MTPILLNYSLTFIIIIIFTSAQFLPPSGIPWTPMLVPEHYHQTLADANDMRTPLILGLMGLYSRTLIIGPPWNLRIMGSAFTIALDEINSNSTLLPDHKLTYVLGMSDCDAKYALDSFITLQNFTNPVGWIGPVCEFATEVVGLLASQWNTPIVSYSGPTSKVSDKKVYDTFSRTIGTSKSMADCIIRVLEKYNWNHIGRCINGPINHDRLFNVIIYYMLFNVIIYLVLSIY